MLDAAADAYAFFGRFRGVPFAVFGCVAERLPPFANGAAFLPPNGRLAMP
jgi:hypothetical protein